MRILFLGGTRFIGIPAVRQLVALGHEVVVFHRGKTTAELPSSVKHLYGDHAQLPDFREEFRQVSPDVVVDMVAHTEHDGNMLQEVFQGLAKRLVVISSVDVYRAYDRFRNVVTGDIEITPLREDSPLRDRYFPYQDSTKSADDFYNRYDKILMERTVQSAPNLLPATVLRLPMVYGTSDYQHRTFPYLKRMTEGRKYILLSEGQADWCGTRGYVEDTGLAITLCALSEQAVGRTYHVADLDNATEYEWVERIARAVGWTGEIVVLPQSSLPVHLQDEYEYRQSWSLDTSRIREELGYQEVVSSEIAMERTIAWQRNHTPKEVKESDFDYEAEDAALAAFRS